MRMGTWNIVMFVSFEQFKKFSQEHNQVDFFDSQLVKSFISLFTFKASASSGDTIYRYKVIELSERPEMLKLVAL